MPDELNLDKYWAKSLKRPFYIAGPCSAESEEQVFDTAKSLKSIGIDLFRAGIWKPRTRPNSFEGIGAVGLPWLKRVKDELNLPITIEVANPRHVELALEYGIDVLWIGARTTVNPFQVQEIAEALKGVDIPVIVKNPVNPDINLWIGAFERLNNVGITKLAAMHRGFSTYEKSVFRNAPQWEIPIDLKRRLPHLPIFCDPSHIMGKREGLGEVAQKALDLNYNGIMLETHPNPAKAWSDPEQQVTPRQLNEMLGKLVIRQQATDISAAKNELEKLRANIDRIDYLTLDLLAERMDVARKIGAYKKENNITILAPERWDEIIKTR
ncbi:MAG: bifunctional 3-deoxy-7-phosphoheptulonate synthase/chorismate mutase type II, partial [Chitinophagales bacterium]